MPDNYGAEIRIWPWPEDHAAVRQVAEWLTDSYGEIQIEDGSEAVGAPIVSPGGELTVEIEEACEGVEEFLKEGVDPSAEPSLVTLLREAGLSFVARDEGRYEHEGREISWRPGLAEVRERAILAGGAVALPQRTGECLFEGVCGVQAVERLRDYFAPLEHHVGGSLALTAEAVVCEGKSGAPSVLYASEGVDQILVIPPYRDEERDVYGPADVLRTIAEIESLRGFPASEVLRDLVAELRETANAYQRSARQRADGVSGPGRAEGGGEA
jgi:hypothetical protein